MERVIVVRTKGKRGIRTIPLPSGPAAEFGGLMKISKPNGHNPRSDAKPFQSQPNMSHARGQKHKKKYW